MDTDMTLVYDTQSDNFVGPTVHVPRWPFDEAIEDLVEGGLSEDMARMPLLNETEWAEGKDTEPLAARCMQCRQPLGESRRHLCDAVCEASFYAEPTFERSPGRSTIITPGFLPHTPFLIRRSEAATMWALMLI